MDKIFCSADEYTWLEDGLRIATLKYNKASRIAKPGTCLADSIPGFAARMEMYKTALSTFAVRPGSVRSKGGEMILSREFGDEFGKTPGARLNLVPIIVDESKIPFPNN